MPTLTHRRRLVRDQGDLPPRLGLVASYFDLSGSLMSAMLVGGPLLLLFSDVELTYRNGPMTVLTWALSAITAFGFLWTGRELRRGSRTAGISASLALIEPLVTLARGASPVSLTTVLAGAGLAVLISVWRDLE